MDQELDMLGPEPDEADAEWAEICDATWEAYLDEVLRYDPEMAAAEAEYDARITALAA
jgi:hypothetical protein